MLCIECAWPSFADQPYITNYRVYDDRVGETTRFAYLPDHEWYWFPQQKPTEVSMLKCYDSVTDGSVSRWSFHTACIDPTTPDDAPCRKNVVVRLCLLLRRQEDAAERGRELPSSKYLCSTELVRWD
jgi:hypothetical protein